MPQISVKPSFVHVATGLFKRAFSARQLRQARRIQRRQKFVARVRDDAQLKLYGELMPGGFLHYGYFDDPQTAPREISLNDIARAQLRYAHVVLQNIGQGDGPILDVGCGMGGLTRLLLERGVEAVALSPDAHQIAHVKREYPAVETLQMRFEDLNADEHAGRYGALITAESLQYLEMEVALPLIQKVLKPGGRWIACDYFRLSNCLSEAETWESFAARLERHGFEVCARRDITPHVLPTLAYLHLWGAEIAGPILRFGVGKIKRKQPGLHHLLQESLEMLDGRVEHHLDLVCPDSFAANFQYVFLEIQLIREQYVQTQITQFYTKRLCSNRVIAAETSFGARALARYKVTRPPNPASNGLKPALQTGSQTKLQLSSTAS